MTDTPPIAVVGTGTGVEKTVVTAGLTRLLREAGREARAIKPAQTGHLLTTMPASSSTSTPARRLPNGRTRTNSSG